MESLYKNMQSYPNQKDQMYYGPHYYPGMEAVPTQMHVNPAPPPMGYGCWPWGSNYGYPSPSPSPSSCHGCCNRTYMPAHCAWGSPYSHAPQHHCPGNYPSFPVQYMPPPPFYMMEQPRYEYEKNVPNEHHCCGCPNHPLHQKEQRHVKIEEEEPERERRRNETLVPFRSKNMPYPIMWLPPEYNSNKEQGKVKYMGDGKDGSHDVKAHENGNMPYPIVWLPPDYSSNKEQGKVKNSGDRKDVSCDVKAHENGKTVGQQPNLWNGWLPLDLNNLVSPKNRGDGEEKHEEAGGNQNFPFPLFWMPYKPEEKEREHCKVKDEREHYKVKDADTKPSLELEKGSVGEQNFLVNRENIGDQAASKARDIPVKKVEQHVEKETSVNQEKERGASVKGSNDNGEKKVDNGEKACHKEGSKGKSPSPPNSSKLPPVCLRVDPLPKRKNGNGSSRSPSPPGNKQKLDTQSNDRNKVLNSSDNKGQPNIPHNELKEDKGTKTIEVVDGSTSHGKTIDLKVDTPVKLPPKSQDDLLRNQAQEKPKEEHNVQKFTENDAVIKGHSEDAGSARGKNEGSSGAQEMKADEVKKSCRRKLCEEEAAVIIQSAYRGYDVRRWEPIKKLKQIAKVGEQIADVKNLIQAVKSSSDIQGHSKQRNIVAETIMSLLLKLDTIQGLHPSIREVRKSVVRELVRLQEQLDSLLIEKPEDSPGEEESMMRRDDDALNKSEDVISSQNGNVTTPIDLLEAQQNQSDRGSNYEKSEISDADLIGEAASEKTEKEPPQSSMNKGAESAPEPIIKENEKRNELLGNDETIVKQDHEDLVLSQGDEVSSRQDDDSAKVTDTAANNHGTVVNELAELPQGVIDDFCAQEGSNGIAGGTLVNELAELPQGVIDDFCAQEGSNVVAVETDACKADQAKQLEESVMVSPIVPEPHDAADKDSNQTVETQEVLDLPLNGIIVEPETEGICPIERSLDDCKLDDKFDTEEEVDSRTGDARAEPDECTVQHMQDFIADMIKPSEASDDKVFPNAEACIGDYTTCDKLQENHGVTDSNSSSVLEEPLDAPVGKQMPSQLLQEGNLEQETSLVNESGDTDEATDTMVVGGAGEAKSDDKRTDSDSCITQQNVVTEIDDSGEVSKERQPQTTESCQPDIRMLEDVPRQGEKCNTEQPLPKETLEKVEVPKDVPQHGDECNTNAKQPLPKETLDEGGLKDASTHEDNAVDPTSVEVPPARDEVTDSNRKLIEENERLRDMMEKLIKSGQEQLMAISSLSGRVKDLEKKLSRKKKLKLKQYKAPRSGSWCMTKFDGDADKRAIGVAM